MPLIAVIMLITAKRTTHVEWECPAQEGLTDE